MKERLRKGIIYIIQVSVRESVRYVGHKAVDLRFKSRCDCVDRLYAMKERYSVKEISCKLSDGMTAKTISQITRVLHCSYFLNWFFACLKIDPSTVTSDNF